VWTAARRPARTAGFALGLTLAAALLHGPVDMLTHPYWLDEAWVADSLRAPLSDLPRLASSSPVGWAFLLRLVPPFLGDHGARLVPLLFSGALCPLAYELGRELDPRGRYVRWLLAFAGGVLPAGMLRQDLKQYSADAFVAVLLLLLGLRAERLATPPALAALAGAGAASLLFSHTAALAGCAVLAGVVAAHASRREWRRCGEAAVAAAAFLVAVALDWAVLGRRALTPALEAFWEPYYVPSRGTASFLGARLSEAAVVVGLGPSLVMVAFLVLGVALLWVRGHRSAAVAVPVLVLGGVAASALRLYPLWEQRTSLYLFAVVTLVSVYGVAAVATSMRRHAWAPVAAIVFAVAASSVMLRIPLPEGDVGAIARRVARERRPGDVVVVDRRAAYGWAYYWHGQPRFRDDDSVAVGFVPAYPEGSGIVVMGDPPTAPEALGPVVAGSPTRTVWVVLSPWTHPGVYVYAARREGTAEVLVSDGGYHLLRLRGR
jgi:hypothetical protein